MTQQEYLDKQEWIKLRTRLTTKKVTPERAKPVPTKKKRTVAKKRYDDRWKAKYDLPLSYYLERDD